jgi:quercetin dioxygenase-like cupin family protein
MSLKEYKNLVNSLPNLNDLLVNSSFGKAEYKTTTSDGKLSSAKAVSLLSEPAVAVMRFRMDKGESIEAHQHKESEAIFVVNGSFETFINGTKRIVKKGQVVYYAPEDEHYGTVIEDLDCLCVSIPKADGYPNGDK